jgi:hypothetical protein
MGEAVDNSLAWMAPGDVHALVAYLRSVPPITSPDLPATLAPPASASPKESAVAGNALGKKLFAEACVNCHSWTGVSALSPFATLPGARAVNDPTATNVAQIVISGTRRDQPAGILSMPGFGNFFSDTEIAAVVCHCAFRQHEIFSDHRSHAQAGLALSCYRQRNSWLT